MVQDDPARYAGVSATLDELAAESRGRRHTGPYIRWVSVPAHDRDGASTEG